MEAGAHDGGGALTVVGGAFEAGDAAQVLEQHRRRPGQAPFDGLGVADGAVYEVGAGCEAEGGAVRCG